MILSIPQRFLPPKVVTPMPFLRTLKLCPLIIALASMTSTIWAQEQVRAPARPGKGLSFALGDYAEYLNTVYSGDKITSQFTTIMIATGQEGNLFVVEMLTVIDDKLSSRRNSYYDVQKASVQEDELIQSSRETISIAGKKLECVWEKRRNPGGTGTFWKSPELPFDQYAKVVMEGGSGQKLVTELVNFGPVPNEENKAMEFVKRLDKLNRESADLAAAKKARSLTFVYGLGGQNEYVLVNSPETRQRLGLTDEQAKQIQAIMRKADQDLTALRLSTLKGLNSDFADLKIDDKIRTSKRILDGAKAVNLETNGKVMKLLTQSSLRFFIKLWCKWLVRVR